MKKFMLFLAAAALGWMVHAEAMYWQVGSWESASGFDQSAWTMAQVRVKSSDGAADTFLKVWDGEKWSETGGYVAKTADGAWFDLSGYSGDSPAYSFTLELVNDVGDVIAAQRGLDGSEASMSYSEIRDQGVIISSFDSVAPSDYKSWVAGHMDVPEPTSGLLVLLGTSLLALRRKRA